MNDFSIKLTFLDSLLYSLLLVRFSSRWKGFLLGVDVNRNDKFAKSLPIDLKLQLPLPVTFISYYELGRPVFRGDFWLISNLCQDEKEETGIKTAVRTDHSAIVISFNSLDEQMRGPCYWKINSSLMKDGDYVPQ